MLNRGSARALGRLKDFCAFQKWREGKMAEVRFYESVEDARFQFAVVIARFQDGYVFCRHRDRDTWETPGGRREPGESILETARRELHEETGALDFAIEPVCAYSVTAPGQFGGRETFGMLYYADIKRLETELHCEIGQIMVTPGMPEKWTYPDIQPKLMEEAGRRGFAKGNS